MTQASASQHELPRQNWATNIHFQAADYHAPETLEQLQELISQSTKVKVVGAGHCFNDIADTTGTLLSLHQLDKTVSVDALTHTATVPAGMTYAELAPILHQEGYALPNMASLPQITLIGACATATHGSGDGNGNLATHVSGLEVVRADGEVVSLSRKQDGERFNGMVVALGGLGAVTKVTLDLVPSFHMQQQVYRRLPLAAMQARFDPIMSSGYSVSLFTVWREKIINQVWVKQKLDDDQPLEPPPVLFGAGLATEDLFPVDGRSANPCTTQMGIPGLWYDRLPHFHLDSKLTGGNELQTEYFVSRKDAVNALMAIEQLSEQMAPVLTNSEVRSVAADNLWLSMAYKQDCIAIHFSWQNRWDEVAKFLPILEGALAPYQARPHWGKLFTMKPGRMARFYEKMPDFQALLNEFDPNRKFSNSYLGTYIWGR